MSIEKNIFCLNWDEIVKSHQYSRKEFKDGKWIYYYDKHNNHARITQCITQPLKLYIDTTLDPEIQTAIITDKAIDYIENIWLKDWEKHPEKQICKEFRNKKIHFSDLSYTHIWKQGGNSTEGVKIRAPENVAAHVRYLPLAKELLENNGVWTEARYEKLNNPFYDENNGKKVVGHIYQTISGGNSNKNSKNKYVTATITKRKYEDGSYSDDVYISVDSVRKIKKSMALKPRSFISKSVVDKKLIGSVQKPSCHTDNKSILKSAKKSIKNTFVEINIKDVTEGNKQAKIDCLEKAFYEKLHFGKSLVEYVPDDNTKKLKDVVTLKIRNFDGEKLNKAVRTLSFSLDTPLKAPKGELFAYKSQEDLTNKITAELTEKTKALYSFLIGYFGLPEMRIVTKADLTYKGKVLYSPETGKPITVYDPPKIAGYHTCHLS